MLKPQLILRHPQLKRVSTQGNSVNDVVVKILPWKHYHLFYLLQQLPVPPFRSGGLCCLSRAGSVGAEWVGSGSGRGAPGVNPGSAVLSSLTTSVSSSSGEQPWHHFLSVEGRCQQSDPESSAGPGRPPRGSRAPTVPPCAGTGRLPEEDRTRLHVAETNPLPYKESQSESTTYASREQLSRAGSITRVTGGKNRTTRTVIRSQSISPTGLVHRRGGQSPRGSLAPHPSGVARGHVPAAGRAASSSQRGAPRRTQPHARDTPTGRTAGVPSRVPPVRTRAAPEGVVSQRWRRRGRGAGGL